MTATRQGWAVVLRAVKLLATGERTTAEMMTALDTSRDTVERLIATLRAEGWQVETRTSGRHSHHRLSATAVRRALEE